MAELDDLPDFPVDDPLETDGQIISRSLTSGRRGSAIPQQFRTRQQASLEQDREWRQKLAAETLQVRKDADKTAREAAMLKAAETKFGVMSKMLEIQDQRSALEQSSAVLGELTGLDYKMGDYANRVTEILRRNPRALDNPRLAAVVDGMLGRHDNYLKDFRTDKLAGAERNTAKEAADAALAAGRVEEAVTTKADGVTRTFSAPKSPASETLTVTEKFSDIDKRLNTEFGVTLADVNAPGAKMRRVDPSKPDGKNGDNNGSHYAFDVKDKNGERTVLIPVDRFKAYADEYATARGGKGEPAATPAPSAPAASATPAPKTVWKIDAKGNKWEYDAETKQPTGKYFPKAE